MVTTSISNFKGVTVALVCGHYGAYNNYYVYLLLGSYQQAGQGTLVSDILDFSIGGEL